MHVAGGGQHQLTACVIVRQRGLRMLLVLAQGNNFAVLNLYGLVRRAGLHRHTVFVVKTGFQQHVIEIVMRVSDFHGVVRFAV